MNIIISDSPLRDIFESENFRFPFFYEKWSNLGSEMWKIKLQKILGNFSLMSSENCTGIEPGHLEIFSLPQVIASPDILQKTVVAESPLKVHFWIKAAVNLVHIHVHCFGPVMVMLIQTWQSGKPVPKIAVNTDQQQHKNHKSSVMLEWCKQFTVSQFSVLSFKFAINLNPAFQS